MVNVNQFQAVNATWGVLGVMFYIIKTRRNALVDLSEQIGELAKP